MSKPETVTFLKTVEIADADGVAITEGSVLREINDGVRGVVMRIVRAGEFGTAFDCVGDVKIRTSSSSTRCTNRYNQWRHIPHNEQTYEERYMSWMKTAHHHDEHRCKSKDEDCAIDGIMALLPDDAVDWNYECGPHSLEDALRYLVAHLTEITK